MWGQLLPSTAQNGLDVALALEVAETCREFLSSTKAQTSIYKSNTQKLTYARMRTQCGAGKQSKRVSYKWDYPHKTRKRWPPSP